MKNKSVFILWIVVVIITTAVTFYVLYNREKPPVKLGVVLPLTGDFAAYGKMGLNGAQMAIEEINRTGGVLNGRPIKLIVEDNQTDPNVSVRMARKLIQEDDVIAILGPVSSNERNAMMEVNKQFKVPLLYGISYEGGVYNRYLFCYSPVPEHMINPLVPYMIKNYGNSFYIFGYDYVWPHKMTEAIKKEVEKVGGRIVGTEFTPFGVKDFSETIGRIKQSGASNLMLIMPGPDGYSFIRQFNNAGLKDKVKIAAIASDEAYLKAMLPEELEGIITSVHFLSSMNKPETQSFVKRQRELFGNDTMVTYSTESHYGLVMMLREAINNAGSLEKEKIIDAMENLDITVGNGTVTMREDHHMNLNMVIAEFKNGQLLMKVDIGKIGPKSQK